MKKRGWKEGGKGVGKVGEKGAGEEVERRGGGRGGKRLKKSGWKGVQNLKKKLNVAGMRKKVYICKLKHIMPTLLIYLLLKR